MADQKTRQLIQFLRTLPSSKADRLAVAFGEGASSRGSLGGLPYEMLLRALRGPVREADLRRGPDLRRFICQGLEPFLTNEEVRPGLGRIPRRVLAPWWAAVTLLHPEDTARLTAEWEALRDTNQANPVVAGFGRTARKSVAGWTAHLVDVMSQRGKLPDEVALLRRTLDGREHVTEIGRLLDGADDVGTVLREIDGYAEQEGVLDAQRRIVDLPPNLIDRLRRCYLAFEAQCPAYAGDLLHAICNRMQHPWQILRLGRAAAVRRDEMVIRIGELSSVARRLLASLNDLVQEIATMMPDVVHSPSSEAFARAGERIERYTKFVDGFVSEIAIKRESEWGEAILGSRRTMGEVLSQSRLSPLADVIDLVAPSAQRAKSAGRQYTFVCNPGYTPSQETVTLARSAVELLCAIARLGERHGFSSGVRVVLGNVSGNLEGRAEKLLAEVIRTDVVTGLCAQVRAIGEVMTPMVGNEDWAELLERQIRLAVGAPASE
jgi:hypothetical protein